MDRTVKFFEDGTEIISRYTGTHFTYIRGKIKGEIKQFGGGKVTKFTVSTSNGKKKGTDEWNPPTYYDCTAFGDKGQEIKDRYSDGDEIELFAKFNKSKSGDRYFYGFNVVDVPRMKPESSDNPYPDGNQTASGNGDFEEIDDDPDALPF